MSQSEPSKSSFDGKELLDKCWDDQRSEIEYRRTREHTIFQFAATVWLAASGYLLANGVNEQSFLRSADWVQRLWLSILIAGTALITHRWIAKQRFARAESEEVLAEIQSHAGCYDANFNGKSALPIAFRDRWATPPAKKLRRSSYKLMLSCYILPLVVVGLLWSQGWPKPGTQERSKLATPTPAPSLTPSASPP